MGLASVIDAIKKHNSFLLTTHVNSEGDAIGSELALSSILRRLNKKVNIVNESTSPKTLNFLPEADRIKKVKKREFSFETAFILDCSDFDRIGAVKELIGADKLIVNIDHHRGNTRFGDINWIGENSSSTGEMLLQLYSKLGLRITKKEATFLYIAILTDTGSFRYANTTPRTHRAVAKLLERGIEPCKIYEKIYENFSFSARKLLGYALATLQKTKDGRIAWIWLTRKDFKKTKALLEETIDFVNFPRFIKTVKVAIFFMQNPNKKNEIKISMRSKGDVNVYKIAKFFGGGGHPTAAGCTLKGSMKKIEKMVLRKVKQAVK